MSRPNDFVGVAAAGGEQQDRHGARLADAAADLHAVVAGQHDVQQDQVEVPVRRLLDRPGPSAASLTR